MSEDPTPARQYYVTAEIKPKGVEIVRIDSYPSVEHAHDDSSGHVKFLRSVGQRRPPHGKLETKPLLRALASWPMQVLLQVAGSSYGFLGDDAMTRGLRPLGDDSDGMILAVNRCALNEAGDDDRIRLARESKGKMYGPCELVECSKHPGEYELHRWTWDVPSDGDHVSAIEAGSDAEIVSSCPKCIEERDDDDRRSQI